MKNKNWYRKRFYLLLFGLLVLIWAAITFSFSNTFKLKDQLNRRVDQLAEMEQAPIQLERMKQELILLDRKLGKVWGEGVGNQVLRVVGEFSDDKNIALHEMAPRHIHDKEGMLIITQVFIVRGSFKNSLLLMKMLEDHSDIGNLRSVSFSSQKDFRTGKTELLVTYYVQSVQKKQ